MRIWPLGLVCNYRSSRAAIHKFIMEWSREKTIEFIYSYKTYSLLWDCEHEFYRNRDKRSEALEELAKQFETQVPKIEKKIKNLQSHFHKERKRKQLLNKKTQPIWFAYKPLSFLLSRNMPPRSNDMKSIAGPPLQNSRKEVPETTQASGSKRNLTNSDNSETLPESLSVVQEMFRWFKQRDEFDLYGEQIAIKLRNVSSPIARVTAQNKINILLMEAELGLYNNDSQHASPNMDFNVESKFVVEETINEKDNVFIGKIRNYHRY